MAVLSDPDRADCAARFIRSYLVQLGKTADLDSSEIRTLVNDLDAWMDSQTTAANNAITASVRTKASNATKFAALAWVASSGQERSDGAGL